jgi:pyruvate-ferredoxin/flavodoxin oxidoreductase
MKLASGDSGNGASAVSALEMLGTDKPSNGTSTAAAPAGDYMAPWIDTDECTACDECININPRMFAYNDKKKAYLKDPNAGTYLELVKAAEKCTAGVIHPGLPKDRAEKDVDKLIKRAQPFN